jgi:hypothetical protein
MLTVGARNFLRAFPVPIGYVGIPTRLKRIHIIDASRVTLSAALTASQYSKEKSTISSSLRFLQVFFGMGVCSGVLSELSRQLYVAPTFTRLYGQTTKFSYPTILRTWFLNIFPKSA